MRRLPWEPVSDIQPDREGPEKAAWRWAAGHRGALGLGQRLHLVSFRAPPPSGRLGAHVSPEGLESARKLAVALVSPLMLELRMRRTHHTDKRLLPGHTLSREPGLE